MQLICRIADLPLVWCTVHERLEEDCNLCRIKLEPGICRPSSTCNLTRNLQMNRQIPLNLSRLQLATWLGVTSLATLITFHFAKCCCYNQPLTFSIRAGPPRIKTSLLFRGYSRDTMAYMSGFFSEAKAYSLKT